MLVDINLLPEKQKKNYIVFIIITFLLIVFALGATVLLLQFGHEKEQSEFLKGQILDTKMLTAIQEKKLNDYASSTAVTELNQAIIWTEKLPIPTVFLIRQLSSLLPERGYVLNFSYTDDGIANLTVQFDTSLEAAYFVKNLNDLPYIDQVNLTSLVTSAADDEPEIKELLDVMLPRYIGQFELKLNKSVLKNSVEEGTDG
jgi:type IV pilus assembly protein PilN